MICPLCKEEMLLDDEFLSVTSEPNWKTREGIRFQCKEHTYTTEITIEVYNKFLKFLLTLEKGWIDKILLLFLDHSITLNSVVERGFKNE